MLRQRVIVFSLALALSCAGPVPWSLSLAQVGDTNGDHEVNILDLQQAVAALLAPGGQTALADINGDGVVDILDLQRILNEAGETHAPDRPDRPLDIPHAVPILVAHQAVLAGMREASLALLPVVPPPAVPPADTGILPPPSAYRLTFGLSPHAPPAQLAGRLPAQLA